MQQDSTSPLWEKDFLDHPTGDADALNNLALYVNTTNHSVSIAADASHKKRALAAGGSEEVVENNQMRTITWMADVHIFSGEGRNW